MATCAGILVLAAACALPLFAQSSAESPDALLREAAAKWQAHDASGAVALYREALRVRPASPDGWFALGNVLYASQRYAEAKEAFTQVAVLNPQDGSSWALKGLCEFQTGDYKASFEDMDRGGRLGFGANRALLPLVLYHASLLLNLQERFEESIQHLATFAADGNRAPEIVNALGLSALRMKVLPGDIPSGRRELVLAAGNAEWLFKAHRVEEARSAFDALVTKFTAESGVHYAFGIYLLDSDPQRAFAEFETELRITPVHVAARLQLGFLFLQRGESAEALAVIRPVAAALAQDYRLHLIRGRAYLQTHRSADALTELRRSATLAPDDYETHFVLSQAYRAAGDALSAAKEQAEFNRLKSSATRDAAAEGWWYFATRYFEAKRYGEARDDLQKIVAGFPGDGPAWALLGLCDYELRDYPAALEHLSKAEQLGVSRSPELVEPLHYRLALLLIRSGKHDDAMKQLRAFSASHQISSEQLVRAAGLAALRLAALPEDLDEAQRILVDRVGVAENALGSGRSADASASFARLAADYPNQREIHYLYAVALTQAGARPEAFAQLQAELALNPAHADAQAQLAMWYLQSGDFEKGLAAAQTAARLGPRNFQARGALGWALLAHNREQEGLAELEAAARIAPDIAATRFSLAQAYRAAGRTADAAREQAAFEALSGKTH